MSRRVVAGFVGIALVVVAGVSPAGAVGGAGFPPAVTAADPGWRPADAVNSRRAMPAIHVERWTENGVTRASQVLSYSNHADGSGEPTTRMDYRPAYSGPWTPALDTNTGRPLSDSPTGRFAEARNVARTASGTLVSISSVPVGDVVRNADGSATVPFGRYVSTDHGRSWTVTRATVTLPDLATGSKGVFFQGISVLPDGRWVAPYYYAQHGNGYRFSVRLVVSQPGATGSVWTAAGLIARGADACPGLTSNLTKTGEGFSESTVALRPDGRLVAVLRCDNWTTDPAHRPTDSVRSYLYTSVSADTTFAGWSAPARLTIPATAPGNAGVPTYGVAPRLLKAEPRSNGAPGLVLGFGRPGNVLAFNADGYGTTWTTGASTIAGSDRWNNAPANHGDPDGLAPDGRLWLHHGSSGYLGLAWLGYHEAIVVGDNCQADWGCGYTPPAGDGAYPHGKSYLLWSVRVTY